MQFFAIDSKCFYSVFRWIESFPEFVIVEWRAINRPTVKHKQQTFRSDTKEENVRVLESGSLLFSLFLGRLRSLRQAWLLSTAIRRSAALSPLIHLSLTFDSVQRTAWIAFASMHIHTYFALLLLLLFRDDLRCSVSNTSISRREFQSLFAILCNFTVHPRLHSVLAMH